ncbi:MAG: dienelactone hydrolase family protein [Austwickia sp.]|nr:MAG: dienelactone hydrolase family protein [Austwickia sp.]
MAEVVIFHSALGLRAGIVDAARRLREQGHVVHTPDLYEGTVFAGGRDGYDAGVALMESVGWTTIVDRAWAAVDQLAREVVYLGFSMGAGIAQELAIQRPGARGAILIGGGGAYDEEPWPLGVPVDCHHMVDDPWVDEFAPVRLARLAARAGSCSSVYLYPGDQHLFTDPELPEEYDHDLTELVWRRIMRFLIRLEAGYIPRRG